MVNRCSDLFRLRHTSSSSSASPTASTKRVCSFRNNQLCPVASTELQTSRSPLGPPSRTVCFTGVLGEARLGAATPSRPAIDVGAVPLYQPQPGCIWTSANQPAPSGRHLRSTRLSLSLAPSSSRRPREGWISPWRPATATSAAALRAASCDLALLARRRVPGHRPLASVRGRRFMAARVGGGVRGGRWAVPGMTWEGKAKVAVVKWVGTV